ncbi:MAG TPA: ComEA family DNA-binding protein [Acidimicrobiia bacterium]|nr:ComEA family DNA-binding protein [Acidimicrobiia bacterium]
MDLSSLRLALPLLVIAIVAGVYWGLRAPQEPFVGPGLTALPATGEPDPRSITVHIAGWVTAPGLVELTEGARVADAVAAAGGLRPGADTSAINLAALLSDGEQVSVPGPSGDGTDRDGVSGGAVTPDGVVRLNRADPTELETLPGVGPVLAERIYEFREQNGPFQTLEDLLDVPGIGEAKLANLRDRVVVP